MGSGAVSNPANWGSAMPFQSGGLVGRGPNTYKMSGGGGLYDILYERYSALQEPDMSVESDMDIFVERKGGGLTNLPVVYRKFGSDIDFESATPSHVFPPVVSKPDPKPPPDPFVGMRDPEQIRARAADKAQRLRALEGTLKAPHWMKLLGAGVGAAGEAIGSPSVAVGPGGMPYHVPTLSTSLKSRLADVKQRQMAETAEEKARKRKELETEFVTEEKIFQYPKAVQDRIREILASKLSTQEKRANIAKIEEEARSGSRYRRKGKGLPMSDKEARDKFKIAQKQVMLEDAKDQLLWKGMKRTDGRKFMRAVDRLQNEDNRISYEDAIQFVLDDWKRTRRIR